MCVTRKPPLSLRSTRWTGTQTRATVWAPVRRRSVPTGMLPPLQVRLRGAILTSFLPLEAALDDAVGEVVALDIERAGKPMTLEVAVQVCNRRSV